jgi:hypothetical protein
MSACVRSMENVVAQLNHLRTHPSVAAGIARGEIALHGWFFDIHAGQMLALDGVTGRFVPISERIARCRSRCPPPISAWRPITSRSSGRE